MPCKCKAMPTDARPFILFLFLSNFHQTILRIDYSFSHPIYVLPRLAPSLLVPFLYYSVPIYLQYYIFMFLKIYFSSGDSAWQQSKYLDASFLQNMGYTGQVTTGEISGTLAVDFSSIQGQDFFPSGSPQRLWLDTYSRGVHRFVDQTKRAGLKAYFFVDLLVFPVFVVNAYPNITATNNDGKTKTAIVWNEASRELLSILVNETFRKFPGCDGWIVRTGETYTYDTPYHIGNTPNPNKDVEIWADFVTVLREMVCVQHRKQLFFRSWDNWPSNAAYYRNLTDRVPTHPLLYFSVKHSMNDFVRPARWNPTLGIGKHAQIVEVQLQREYEGKGAYPNYVMDGVINGFREMKTKMGLNDIRHSPQLKGLWTWSRGGKYRTYPHGIHTSEQCTK